MSTVEYIWIFEPCSGPHMNERLVMIRRGDPPKTEIHGVFAKRSYGEDGAKRHIEEYLSGAKHFRPGVRVINAIPDGGANG
jgi:hypothetical protein